MRYRLSPGSPARLGATVDRAGTNFALVSHHAERVELCLFDDGDAETARIALPEKTAGIWHGRVEGIGAGQRYGYRVHGPFDPRNGQRFNRNKLLIDPYAPAIDRPFRLAPSMLGYLPDHPEKDLSFNPADSAADMPKAIVVAAAGAAPDTRPRIPRQDTILYEMHVKGFTQRLDGIAPALRGTFAALAEPAALEHLVKLGVTTLELMPIAAVIDERHLPPLGLHNYWGYNPVAFLAPDPRLVPGDALAAMRGTVERIHAAGLEIVLDVVFNHTGESDELGPTVSYRGIDNALYYRLGREARFYDNVTGCGNTLAVDRPPVLRLVMDAMRHWVTEIGVDGFRFDLATTLARDAAGFQPEGAFLAALQQDPVLGAAKLIAEPWDLGPGGYRGGGFPPGMAEWNDRFRDDMRRFWQGGATGVGALASRLAGSSDRFDPARRLPSDGVNYVTAHDGFSLLDLVSYSAKHNEANGERNADGTDDNISWNHGVEGPSDDPEVEARRRADLRALIAAILVSRGTPMLRAGDELGQTQGGNNNAYAQDNATTWIDWARAKQFADLTGFTRRAIALRKAHPALHRDRFLTGHAVDGASQPDACWRREDGAAMTDAEWRDPARKFLGLELNEPMEDGTTDHVYLIVNGHDAAVTATLPPADRGWRVMLDSAAGDAAVFAAGATLTVAARAIAVLSDDGAAAGADHPERLDRLALLAGIEPQHRDATGRDHIVGPETKRALLAAMRVPAGSAAEIRASLSALAEDPWRATLAPVIRARAGRRLEIEVVVDQSAAGDRLEAVLAGEDGARFALQFRPSDGVPLEARRAGGTRREKWRVALEHEIPLGVHRLSIGDADATVLAAPERAWQPAALAAGKCWGIAANLYSARSARDWGIGDLSTLGEIAARTAERGGALVGINPLHALFPDRPDDVSPYYPSDRRFLEPAYIDVATMPDYRELMAGDPWFATAEREAARLRAAPLVDYGAVFALKWQGFRKVWAHFRAQHDKAGDPLGDAFRGFIAEGGEALQRFAAWPGAAADETRFRLFLQWWADRSLAEASKGLSIGLYRDLAVGPAPYGAEAQLCGEAFATGVSVGSPPDPYSAVGQVWGVPPFDPRALRRLRLGPWRDLVRANMRHAGALRLDHVMGLERLLWIPEGATALEGAYVRNDAASLLAVLAIESHRRNCLVVGEDLGTVPSGFRERMAAAGLYAMSVILFERDGAGFAPGSRYPRQSVAMFGTHDLLPLQGWWAAHAGDGEGAAMAAALGLDAGRARMPAERSAAVHAFLGRSESAIALAQYDDLAGETIPVNIPGTVAEHPNWRRRNARAVDAVFDDPEGARGIAAVAAGRTSPKEPSPTPKG
ncbi:MAG TPA: glycogen debranching protein GlgX [Dongiaceae bacterium]|nr:glycogen debranching protein GlgX [Dongiaceae bacterium]